MYKNVFYFLQILSLLLIYSSVQAQVYKCENSIGEVRFSDEVCKKGESTRRLNWLSSSAKAPKNKPVKKTNNNVARQIARNNEAYALLSLLTNTRLELDTVSLRSSYKDESTDAPELILPDGIIVDLLKVDKIILTSQRSKKRLKAHFIMLNGYEEVKILKSPYPIIKGKTQIGRFSQSLKDIKKIEFFNSKILWNKTFASDNTPYRESISVKEKERATRKHLQKSPIIDLDLSHQIQEQNQPKVVLTTAKPKPVEKVKQIQTGFPIQVKLVNKQTLYLQESELTSSKGEQQSRGQHFIINDTIQIPFNTIKQIKIRPMATNSALLVAIELMNKEIKMEVMLRPYTHLMGKSRAGQFERSLSDIKSIRVH